MENRNNIQKVANLADKSLLIVDDDNLAHPGSRKIEQGGGTKPAGTEHRHPCRLQLQLPRHADLGQNQLTCIEGTFGRAQLSYGLRRGFGVWDKAHPDGIFRGNTC